ncbi:MBL fold metallo-hydrolase [Actinoplanes subtropicus]|uniref:MBL fold metallo-hydrolase n=1 Tax=Actinoplanes subtropicus TaxID=543632 RepID=UPI0004C3755F|nr:MBL fold metallo-hydrolase [Actinoplanes subtropicus]
MTDLTYTIIDGDFPAGVKNKTATLVTGETEALLVDTGFTRADGHRLAAAVLDSGRQLTTVVISHADPDFYFGAEVIADAFPDARILATPEAAATMAKKYEGKLKAWAALGANLPTRLIETEPLTGDLQFAGHTFELKGAPTALPDRTYLYQAEDRAILGGVLVFADEHVWIADTPRDEQLDAWDALLADMQTLDPVLVVPGHRQPTAPADASALAYTREYLAAFRRIVADAADGAAATEALLKAYPQAGMQIAAQLGPKVVKGEMNWG